ncbi:MAG: thioredoxin family protein [Chloroflexi bacterium]|nr:thioredoxin family protein [Chloroflexota bacterium]MBV9894850.1 thioredoxin family protein [Chloroflexota bacterium]
MSTPSSPTVSPERFAQGMTFEQYVAYLSTPQNLQRESTSGLRVDRSAFFRDAFAQSQLSTHQAAALRWLTAQPNPPARMLAISEDWSSDCRRDIPTFARMADVGGLELRIFDRDGQKFSAENVPSRDTAPDSNADLMAQFLNHKNGQTFQSIPVCAFFTKEMEYLYHFTEYPAIYDKDRVVMQHIRAPRPNETPEQTRSRADREFGELVDSPFWRIWTSATVDEILSALHRKAVLGVV